MIIQPAPPPKKPSYAYAHLHKTSPVFNFQVRPRSHLKHTLTIVHNTSVAVLTRPGNDPRDIRHRVQTVCGDHPDSSPVVNRWYFAGGGSG